MLTTIFTGHTLDLLDIVAIGPIMQIRKGVQGSLYRRTLNLVLHLKHGVVLSHDDLSQEIIYEPQAVDTDAWKTAHQALSLQRTGLNQAWRIARGEPVEEQQALG